MTHLKCRIGRTANSYRTVSQPTKILAFVIAGGEGRRLRPLTEVEAKPAVRFFGESRIIDFVLANLVNSLVAPIYVLAQYKPDSLLEHVRRTWCPHWPVYPLLPDAQGPYRGTAEAVYRNLHLIACHRADTVAVFAADHVYRMDVRQMARFHAASKADATVAAVPVPVDKASAFGIMAVGRQRRIEQFEEKPARPRPVPGNPAVAYASMGNYLFKPASLRRLLDQGIARGGMDFGRDILPALPGSPYRVVAYDFAENEVPGVREYEDRAYWRDVGTLDALEEARRDVAGPRPRLDLGNHAWPIQPSAAAAHSSSV